MTDSVKKEVAAYWVDPMTMTLHLMDSLGRPAQRILMASVDGFGTSDQANGFLSRVARLLNDDEAEPSDTLAGEADAPAQRSIDLNERNPGGFSACSVTNDDDESDDEFAIVEHGGSPYCSIRWGMVVAANASEARTACMARAELIADALNVADAAKFVDYEGNPESREAVMWLDSVYAKAGGVHFHREEMIFAYLAGKVSAGITDGPLEKLAEWWADEHAPMQREVAIEAWKAGAGADLWREETDAPTIGDVNDLARTIQSYAGRLEKMIRQAAFGGDDVSVRVRDPEALIGTMRKVPPLLRTMAAIIIRQGRESFDLQQKVRTHLDEIYSLAGTTLVALAGDD